jgi:LacI family transcriptional regulator
MTSISGRPFLEISPQRKTQFLETLLAECTWLRPSTKLFQDRQPNLVKNCKFLDVDEKPDDVLASARSGVKTKLFSRTICQKIGGLEVRLKASVSKKKPIPPTAIVRAPSILDVASRAGVSAATVSNVLTGLRGVSQHRRRLVLEAVSALGYKSNHMASSLRTGQTRTIGVVVPTLANELFSCLVRRWEQHAAQDNYEIIVVASGDDPITEARRLQSLIARQVDGILVVAAKDDFGAAHEFPPKLPPTVLVDRAFGHAAFDTVASDNFEAGYQGTKCLLNLGHQDISLLISSNDHIHLRDRIDGYHQALIDVGLVGRKRVIIGGGSVEQCRGAIEQDLRRPDPPTAIFAATFFSTLGAIKAIRSLEIMFPEEISLVAFEHSEWMTVFRPYLCCVSQTGDELARRSWEVLMQRLGSRTSIPVRIKIPCQLDVRESVRPPIRKTPYCADLP